MAFTGGADQVGVLTRPVPDQSTGLIAEGAVWRGPCSFSYMQGTAP